MGATKIWAKGLSQEEQEEYLADPTTAKVYQAYQAQMDGQRHRLVEACRTSDLAKVRFEAGVLDGMRMFAEELKEEEHE